MGLGNFTDGEEENSTNREYYRIHQDEFEEFLNEVDNEFYIIGTEEDSNLVFTRELVYGKELGHEDLQLRVYSTIDERYGRARDKGDDAIRTVIWSKELSHPIGGRTKTLRIKTWKSNLLPKLEEIIDGWGDKVVNCDECGGWMVKRDPDPGDDWDTFYGCAKYPVCKNSENITKLREKHGKDI